MTEFQAGDILECAASTDQTDYTTRGAFYRCEGPWSRSGFSRDIRLHGVGWSCRPSRFRLAFRPPAGEVWEPWNGGEPPTLAGVEVAFRDGTFHRSRNPARNSFDWSNNADPGGVIAYRVIPAEAEAAYTKAAILAPKGAAPIDPNKIKAGDEVTVRGVVNSTKDIDGTFQVIVDGQYTAYAPASAIVGHTPKAEPLKVGDMVRLENLDPAYQGTILGLHEGLAWINYTSGGYTTAAVASLTRIDALS